MHVDLAAVATPDLDLVIALFVSDLRGSNFSTPGLSQGDTLGFVERVPRDRLVGRVVVATGRPRERRASAAERRDRGCCEQRALELLVHRLTPPSGECFRVTLGPGDETTMKTGNRHSARTKAL